MEFGSAEHLAELRRMEAAQRAAAPELSEAGRAMVALLDVELAEAEEKVEAIRRRRAAIAAGEVM